MHAFDYNLPLFQISKIHLPTGVAQGVPTFGFLTILGTSYSKIILQKYCKRPIELLFVQLTCNLPFYLYFIGNPNLN